MGARGTGEIDFGAYPGSTNASVVITGQSGITAPSAVEVWIRLAATSGGSGGHSVDEHKMFPGVWSAGDIVPGVGFTAYAVVPQFVTLRVLELSRYFMGQAYSGGGSVAYKLQPDPSVVVVPQLMYGKWSFFWVWDET